MHAYRCKMASNKLGYKVRKTWGIPGMGSIAIDSGLRAPRCVMTRSYVLGYFFSQVDEVRKTRGISGVGSAAFDSDLQAPWCDALGASDGCSIIIIIVDTVVLVMLFQVSIYYYALMNQGYKRFISIKRIFFYNHTIYGKVSWLELTFQNNFSSLIKVRSALILFGQVLIKKAMVFNQTMVGCARER
ncbi:hypothetical protein BDC45DRAFT_560898 [Circinella umbellata]|nr:hypothetical protein BDC45DRAFT_560898 [Circinella umbellata]